jgi:PAS fold
LQRLNNGTYLVNYSSTSTSPSTGSRDHNRVLSKELRYILSKGNPSPVPQPEQDRVNFNNFLLDNSEDFYHVLSLKGLFQYVSASVRNVLEYEAEELIGKSISHICHPADITPVIRELKESSSTVPAGPEAGPSAPSMPRTVNLLFRARARRSGYVWIESHGKMYIEPGKGRKSIILVGRRRIMPRLDWRMVERSGGISDDEFWGLISPDGLWLNVVQNVSNVIGRVSSSITGTSLLDMLPNQQHQQQVLRSLLNAPRTLDSTTHSVEMLGVKDKRHFVTITIYPPRGEGSALSSLTAIPIVCQVKLFDPSNPTSTSITAFSPPITSNLSSTSNNLFEELDTTRHTSWQYELTHLRIANKNLLDDIAKLEIEQGLRSPETEPESPDNALEASSLRTKKRSRLDTEQKL